MTMVARTLATARATAAAETLGMPPTATASGTLATAAMLAKVEMPTTAG